MPDYRDKYGVWARPFGGWYITDPFGNYVASHHDWTVALNLARHLSAVFNGHNPKEPHA